MVFGSKQGSFQSDRKVLWKPLQDICRQLFASSKIKMKKKILLSLMLGLLFCLGQSFGESIVGFIITDVRGPSNVNFEGAIMFGTIRVGLTIIPYLAGFIIIDRLTSDKLKPSYISFGLNLIALLYIYFSGLIQEDLISFIIGSILTSLILILIDQRVEFRDLIKTEGK